MNILLDTHIFLWLLTNPGKITDKHTGILKSPGAFYLSAISISEIMVKASIGKLTVNYDPVEMAVKSGLKLLDFSASDAKCMQALPLHHKDPFDRMLIAQSLNRKFSMMTSDAQFKAYNCRLV